MAQQLETLNALINANASLNLQEEHGKTALILGKIMCLKMRNS